jgi:hypothetical protein
MVAWTTLESVDVTPSGTGFRIGALWELPTSVTPPRFRVLKSGKNLSKSHIRPYVICRTPDFLRSAATKPRPWRLSPADNLTVREGRQRLARHFLRERKPSLAAAAKREHMRRNGGRLPCEVCGFDFLEAYGPLGEGFAEAHHKESLSLAPAKGRKATKEGFAVVCANCHRMLHRGPDFPDIGSLKARVRQARKEVKRMRGW